MAVKAKKRASSKKTKPFTDAVVQPNGRAIHIPGTDFNPQSLEGVNGANRKEVAYESETEPRLEAGMVTVEENAKYVNEHWQERIEKEGVPYCECPICQPGQRKKFTGKNRVKDCAGHIKTGHPQRVKELKMKKVPKEAYSPISKIESPKRTLADAVHPKYRPMVEAQLKQREILQPITDHARSLSVHGSPLLKMVSMTESLAIQQLGRLSPKDLVAVVQLARNRGKRLLARAASAMCQKKGINPDLKVSEPSAKYLLLQEALRNSQVAATVQRHG